MHRRVATRATTRHAATAADLTHAAPVPLIDTGTVAEVPLYLTESGFAAAVVINPDGHAFGVVTETNALHRAGNALQTPPRSRAP